MRQVRPKGDESLRVADGYIPHRGGRFRDFIFFPDDLWKEYGRLNWAPVALGLAVVGLETGWIYAYKAGWLVSTGFLTQSAFLAMALLCLGYFLFHETISWSKILGAIICMIGLVFLNR